MNLADLQDAEKRAAASMGPFPLIVPQAAWEEFRAAGLLSQDLEGKWYLYGAGWVVREDYAPQ